MVVTSQALVSKDVLKVFSTLSHSILIGLINILHYFHISLSAVLVVLPKILCFRSLVRIAAKSKIIIFSVSLYSETKGNLSLVADFNIIQYP